MHVQCNMTATLFSYLVYVKYRGERLRQNFVYEVFLFCNNRSYRSFSLKILLKIIQISPIHNSHFKTYFFC